MNFPGVIEGQDTIVETAGVKLEGVLTVPEDVTGTVIFAHGSGSSRFSRRNVMIAKRFNDEGLATLLFDLLTGQEAALDEHTRQYRFDIGLLGRRLVGAVDWVKSQPGLEEFKIGTFGASTGAAAAVIAAAERPLEVNAVVSRGGRPDLAGEALERVRAPTLLIAGALDNVVVDLNRQAAEALQCHYQLTIIPGATHLFGEPGKLEQVGGIARDWFARYLSVS